MNDIAVLVTNEIEKNVYEAIDAIKKAGIKNVFIQWYNKENKDVSQEDILKYIKNQKLNILFAHLSYKNINDIWVEGENGDNLIKNYLNDIKVLKKEGIDMVIMHLTSKTVAPKFGLTGLNRIKKLVTLAEKLDVKIAFENTKIPGYIDYVMENVQSKNVGFCFDAGHYHAHFNDEFNWNLVKNRVFAVHLHDNFGSEDEHLVPFDGTNNWKEIIKNLEESGYEGPITMEIYYRNQYAEKTIVEFYTDVKEIGQKLIGLKDANK